MMIIIMVVIMIILSKWHGQFTNKYRMRYWWKSGDNRSSVINLINNSESWNDLRMWDVLSRFLFFPFLVRIDLVVKSLRIFGERLPWSDDAADFAPGAVVCRSVVVVELEQFHLPLDRRSGSCREDGLGRNDLDFFVSVGKHSLLTGDVIVITISLP